MVSSSDQLGMTCEAAPTLQPVDEVEERLLIHGLSRAGDVAMAVLERIVRMSPRSKESFEGGRKQITERGRPTSPLIGDALAVVTEISEVEFKAAAWLQADDLTHGLHGRGPA